MNKIVCENINPGDLIISKKELALRLKSPESLESDIVSLCTERVLSVVRPRYCYAKSSVSLDGDEISLDFVKLKSQSLRKNLFLCKEAYVVAITLGIETDRLIASMSALSKTEGFIADAVCSALAEAAADYVSSSLAKENKLRPRFSPGYGDLNLSIQRDIVNYLSLEKLMGIKLCENLMMVPRKSITALIGIERK